MRFSLAFVSTVILSTLVATSSTGHIYKLVDSNYDLDMSFDKGSYHQGDRSHNLVKRSDWNAHNSSVGEGSKHAKRELCKSVHLGMNKHALCYVFKHAKRNAWDAHYDRANGEQNLYI